MKITPRVMLCLLLLTLPVLAETTAPDSARSNQSPTHKVIVYYLYFTPRCETCLNMEAFSKEAVESGFARELKDGSVEWHSYDTGDKAYEHFWSDFKLETKSLIMVDMQDGKQVKWKNCEKIWDLVGAKPDFMKYVQDEVHSYLIKNE